MFATTLLGSPRLTQQVERNIILSGRVVVQTLGKPISYVPSAYGLHADLALHRFPSVLHERVRVSIALALALSLSHSSTGCCRSSWHETSLLRTPTPTRPLRSSGSTMILVTDPFLQSCVKVVGSRSLTPRGRYICSAHRHQGQQSSYTPPIPISISISISHREDSPALV